MKGDLIAAGFDNKIYRLELDASGEGLAKKPEPLFSSVGLVPLDVTAQGDEDPFPGTIWAADVFGSSIVVFEPFDVSGCDVSDPDGDVDGDGFTNQDELDNGTGPVLRRTSRRTGTETSSPTGTTPTTTTTASPTPKTPSRSTRRTARAPRSPSA